MIGELTLSLPTGGEQSGTQTHVPLVATLLSQGTTFSMAPVLGTIEQKDRETWVPEVITELLTLSTLSLGFLKCAWRHFCNS